MGNGQGVSRTKRELSLMTVICSNYGSWFENSFLFSHFELNVHCCDRITTNNNHNTIIFNCLPPSKDIWECPNSVYGAANSSSNSFNVAVKNKNSFMSGELVTGQTMGEKLTGCSYADQHRGQVKGPCWGDDEHSNVTTRQKSM